MTKTTKISLSFIQKILISVLLLSSSICSSTSIKKTLIFEQLNFLAHYSYYVFKIGSQPERYITCGKNKVSRVYPCTSFTQNGTDFVPDDYTPISFDGNFARAFKLSIGGDNYLYYWKIGSNFMYIHNFDQGSTQVIDPSHPHTLPYLNYFKSKIPNQNYLFLNSKQPYGPICDAYKFDTLNQSYTKLTGILNRTNFGDTSKFLTIWFYLNNSNSLQWSFNFADYSISSSTPSRFNLSVQSKYKAAAIQYTLDEEDYLLAMRLNHNYESVIYMKSIQNHSVSSFLDVSTTEKMQFLKQIPDSKYMIISTVVPAAKSRLKFVRYEDKNNLMLVHFDDGNEFYRTSSHFIFIRFERSAGKLEMMFTSSISKIFVYSINQNGPSSCNPNCLTCEPFDSRNNSCTSCSSQKVLLDGVCSCRADSPLFMNGSGECQACHQYCSSCTESAGKCTGCLDNFELEFTEFSHSGSCICPSSTHYLTSEGKCFKNTTFRIIKTEFLRNLRQIKVEFNTEIQISQLNLYRVYQKNKINKEIKIKKIIIDLDLKTLIIELDLNNIILEDSTLIINCTEKSYPRSVSDNEDIFKDFPIELKNINYLKTKFEEKVLYWGRFYKIGIQVLSFATFLVNQNQFMNLVKLFQLIDFLHLINVNVPHNVLNFYEAMEGDFLQFLPNPFYSSINFKCEVHKKVKKAGFECLLVNNNGSLILILAVFLLLKWIIFCGQIIFKYFGLQKKLDNIINKIGPLKGRKQAKESNKNNKKEKYVKIILDILYKMIQNYSSWTLLIKLFISLQIDIILALTIYLQAKYYNGKFLIHDQGAGMFKDLLSIVLSIFYIVVYLAISLSMIYSYFRLLFKSKKTMVVKKLESEQEIRKINGNSKKGALNQFGPMEHSNIPKKLAKRHKRDKLQPFYLKQNKRARIHQKEQSIQDKQPKKNDLKSTNQNSSFYFSDIDLPSKRIAAITILISYFRDLVFPLIIIIFMWRPRCQFYSIIAYLISKLIIFIFFMPYKTRFSNLWEIYNDVIYLCVLTQYLVILEFHKFISLETKYYVVGYSIIMLLVILLLSNILFALFMSLYWVFKALQSMIRVKDHKKKVKATLNQKDCPINFKSQFSRFRGQAKGQKHLNKGSQKSINKVEALSDLHNMRSKSRFSKKIKFDMRYRVMMNVESKKIINN